MHGVPLLRTWTKFQKFTLMSIRKLSEIGVVICSKNTKKGEKRGRESGSKEEDTELDNFRSSRPEVFCKKAVLRNFAKFTGKYLCRSLFFNKIADWDLQLYTLFRSSRRHLVSGAKSHVGSVNPTNLGLWFEALLAIWCHMFACFLLLDLWFIIKTKK